MYYFGMKEAEMNRPFFLATGKHFIRSIYGLSAMQDICSFLSVLQNRF